MGEQQRQLLVSVGLGLLEVTSSVLLLGVSVWFICACAVAGQPAAATGFNYLVPATLIRLLAITRIVSGYLERYLGHRVLLGRLASLRSRLLASVLASHSGPEHARAAAALQQHAEDWAAMPTASVTPQLGSVVLLLGLLMFSAVLLPGVFLPLLTLVAVLAIAWLWLVRTLDRLIEQREALQARLDRALEEWLSTSDFWSLRPDWQQGDKVKAHAQGFANARQRIENLTVGGEVVLLTTGLIASVAMLTTLAGELATLVYAVPILLVASMRDWLRPGLHGIVAGRRAVAGLKSLNAGYLDNETLPSHRVPSESNGEASNLPQIHSMVFDRFSWRRDGKTGPALSASLIGPGIHIIAGPSGIGKSSLLAAICGELPHEGGVLVNGEDLYDLSGYRGSDGIYLAEQFSRVLSDTLAHNLRLAAPTADDDALRDALAWSGLDSEHNALDLRHWLGAQGRPLSGGERKRLTLARAKLANAPVWLLDEPFEGLDATMAAYIADKLNAEAINRLIVVVAHQYPDNLTTRQVIQYATGN